MRVLLAVSSVANSSGSWCAVALLLALLPRPRWGAVVVGPLALLGLLAGYELTSLARGYAVAVSTVAEWVVAAVAVGPFLGLGGAGLAARRPVPAVTGSSVLAGVLVGEGVYGLTVVDETTSPVYWTISIAAGVLVPALVARRLRADPRGGVRAGGGGRGAVRRGVPAARLTSTKSQA